ncbi:MAG: hypothetical protein KBD78_06705 [Oligoflexales bacterium]|nr:hypothetical protein [Oligoflexales bacterium]
MTLVHKNEGNAEEKNSDGLNWRDKIGHDETFAKLKQNFEKLGMYPSVLFTGRQGIGKRALMSRYLSLAYCFKQNSCGECKACQLLINSAHPDVFWLDLGGATIKKDDIEALLNHLSFKAQNLELAAELDCSLNVNPLRSAVIVNAQNLSAAAANRLLKVLEEPANNSCLLMSANGPEQILATLRSRLLHISIGTPAREELLRWLTAKFPLLANKTKAELEFLMKSCSYSPGNLLKRCAELVSGGNEFSSQESWHRVESLLNAADANETLGQVQALCKDKLSATSDAMLECIEQVLNSQYMRVCASEKEEICLPSVTAISAKNKGDFLRRHFRRNVLSEFKKQALEKNIAINQQYFLQKIGLIQQ